MNDFLQFLNTADIDSLLKIPGISRSLAENLVAARPFNSVEDCLKVRGMGKNLLVRVQSSFEALEIEPGEHAILPVEPEAMLIEKSRLMGETVDENKPTFGSRLGQALLNFLRVLLRLILLVMLIVGVGAVIYYGAPLLYEKFIAPVEQNATRVGELEDEITNLQAQLTEINNQLAETNSRIDGIEQSVDAHTASLEKLKAMQTTIESQLTENNDRVLLELKHEVMMTRAFDVLARARLYLTQSNFGLAKEDIQSARDLLADLKAEANDEALAQAITRLDMALGNLPNFPVVASGDLDIAWQILMTGEAMATATPEPALTNTSTPGPTPEFSATVTTTP